MKRRYGVLMAGLIGLAGVAGTVAVAQAQDPLAVIDARKAELKKAGGAMKVIGGFVKADAGTLADVQAAAATIDAVAKEFPGWWAAGTAVGVGKSEAKAEIWSKPDVFKAKAMAFQTEAAALVQVAAGGDKAAIGAQLGKTGGACKACHQEFRED